MQSRRLWKRQLHTARAIVQGKVNSPGQGQVQMYKSRDKGKDKGVPACQGKRAIVKTKAIIKTMAKKQQARAIAQEAMTGVDPNIALEIPGQYIVELC